MKKITVFLLVLCLIPNLFCAASAEPAEEYSAVLPLLDLVSAASLYSVNAPESVPGEEGLLSQSFITAFLLSGLNQSAEVGVSQDMLNDTEAQSNLLSPLFTASLPELETMTASDEQTDFIGFYPKTVSILENGDIQLIGGIYTAPKTLRELSGMDFANVSWFETGIITLRPDAESHFGYRIDGFSVGTDLSYEDAFQDYIGNIAVEYMSNLGFSVLYPSDFADENLVEDEHGMTARLLDDTAFFSVTKNANTEKVQLADYAKSLQDAHSGSALRLDEDRSTAVLFYEDGNGYSVFDVIVITESDIYQAELGCKTELLPEYSMFFSFLENSFNVNELSLG